MYQALPQLLLHEFKGHAIIARKGGEPGNEAKGYALLPNVDMCNGCSTQQEYGAAFSKNSVFASC